MSLDEFKQIQTTPRINAYMHSMSSPRTEAQERLFAGTRALGGPAEMQIPHELSILLTMLVRSLRGRTVVEVGTFTGYSTIALAQGLVPGGRVITCDVSDQWTALAREAFRDAGVEDRIEIRLGAAARTLSELPEEAGIDLAFVDADKVSYSQYWDLLIPRLRPSGILVADNALYGGEAADENASGNAAAIRAFNAHARRDPRVTCVMLPVADGILMAQRKP